MTLEELEDGLLHGMTHQGDRDHVCNFLQQSWHDAARREEDKEQQVKRERERERERSIKREQMSYLFLGSYFHLQEILWLSTSNFYALSVCPSLSHALICYPPVEAAESLCGVNVREAGGQPGIDALITHMLSNHAASNHCFRERERERERERKKEREK